MSSDGSRVAIGAFGNDANGSGSGHVRIYDYNGSAWVQVGADIDGEAASDNSGQSVSISSDGSRVAIGAYGNDGNGLNSGHVRIYDYNGSAWVQVGADIDGEAGSDNFGYRVSMSSDGSRVAIGAIGNDENGNLSGHVRIYQYNNNSWSQLGADIDGEAQGDQSGRSVSMSSDGSRVAIGAPYNNGSGSNSGHVRIYDYNGSAWVQVGADIDGEAEGDVSGYSVSISSDGSRVAIGAYGNDANGSSSGHVRIYDYNGSAWVQVGADIDGEAASDQSGESVSISSNGSRVAIGAWLNDGTSSSINDNRGHVRIYDYNGSAWVQVGEDIDGEAASDSSGRSVSMSSDGSRVAIGATYNSGNGTNSGHVRVYSAGPTTSPATLTITSNDSDNLITSGQVTLTATFSINMTASPTISITGVVTNVSMTQSTTAAVWTYYWQVPSNISSGTTLNVTATATDTNNLPYSGNASLTLTISPTFYLASNGVTIKCSGCSAGDTGMVSGTTYTAHDNTSLANKSRTDTDWDRVVTTLVTDMSSLFDGLVSQNQAFNQNLSSWDTSNVTDMSGMFKANNSLSSANQNFNSWDTSKVTDMSYMFESTDYMNPQIDSWDVSSVTNMESMFQDCRLIGYNNSNQAIGSWDVSSVTSMRVMFNRTDYFNIDIGSWDTSSVTDMTSMFYNALVFNQNIGGWNTSNVTNTQAMFNGARQFNQDLNSWDVSKVTTMNSMFKSAPIFNGNISSWNTSSVTDMRQMFDSASRFNQDIGNWNVSSVSNGYSMGSMFQSAGDFVQDISGWCVSQISTEPNNFKNSAGTNSWNSDTSKHPQWGVCNSNVTVTLTDTDADNLLAASDTVTITATFTEAMTATPTISITGVVTNVTMTALTGAEKAVQIGETLYGSGVNDQFGAVGGGSGYGDTHLSKNGKVFAFASGYKNTDDLYRLIVYELVNGTWTNITGNLPQTLVSGAEQNTMALSRDGHTIVIGANNVTSSSTNAG
jgi:surface protein